MNKAKLKKTIYRSLIDSHTGVSVKFRDYLNEGRGESSLRKLGKVFELNLKHRLFRQPLYRPLKGFQLPETGIERHPGFDELINKLKAYDVISFDVFDTLIFRTVEKPTDVFKLLEAKNGIIGFSNYRVEAEKSCREAASKSAGSHPETTLDRIYTRLSRGLSIDKAAAMEAEIEAELAVCIPNPYMKRVYTELVKLGKRVIAVSDMYLPRQAIDSILRNCGYSFGDIFISCEHGVGKRKGDLQRIAEKELRKGLRNKSKQDPREESHNKSEQKLNASFDPKLSFIHIGDNKASDVRGSQRAGWDAVYYPNVRIQGNEYRQHSMTSIQASFYKGLVNIRLHSGARKGGALYEFGYAYGGIMAMGYAQYICRKVRKDKIDQLIFLGRDMYTVHSVYNKYFLTEGCDTTYIPFSRFAAYRLAMDHSRREFYSRIVKHWAHAATLKSIGEVLDITHLSELKGHLSEAGLSINDTFNMAAAGKLEPLYEKYRDELLASCREQAALAKEFFRDLVGDHKNIRIIDLGWSGTCPLILSGFIRENLSGKRITGESNPSVSISQVPLPGVGLSASHIEVSGILMAMIDSSETRTALSVGALEAYMFSPEHNLDNLLSHMSSVADADYRNMLIEILFSEDRPSFLGYKRNEDGSIGFSYSQDEGNASIIRMIHRGILDFCDDYHRYCITRFPELRPISGKEAYIPIAALAQAKDYCMHLLKDYRVSEQSGALRPEDFHNI